MSDSDIVQRLRWCSIGGHGAPNVCDLAADEITSLRKRLAAAEARNKSDYEQACYLRNVVAPQCTSMDDISGVLSQLSNFMAGQRDDLAAAEAENRRLLSLIGDTAKAWLAGCEGIPWEGAIDAAMKAAVAEIRKLQAKLTAAEDDVVAWQTTAAYCGEIRDEALAKLAKAEALLREAVEACESDDDQFAWYPNLMPEGWYERAKEACGG